MTYTPCPIHLISLTFTLSSYPAYIHTFTHYTFLHPIHPHDVGPISLTSTYSLLAPHTPYTGPTFPTPYTI